MEFSLDNNIERLGWTLHNAHVINKPVDKDEDPAQLVSIGGRPKMLIEKRAYKFINYQFGIVTLLTIMLVRTYCNNLTDMQMTRTYQSILILWLKNYNLHLKSKQLVKHFVEITQSLDLIVLKLH